MRLQVAFSPTLTPHSISKILQWHVTYFGQRSLEHYFIKFCSARLSGHVVFYDSEDDMYEPLLVEFSRRMRDVQNSTLPSRRFISRCFSHDVRLYVVGAFLFILYQIVCCCPYGLRFCLYHQLLTLLTKKHNYTHHDQLRARLLRAGQ